MNRVFLGSDGLFEFKVFQNCVELDITDIISYTLDFDRGLASLDSLTSPDKLSWDNVANTLVIDLTSENVAPGLIVATTVTIFTPAFPGGLVVVDNTFRELLFLFLAAP